VADGQVTGLTGQESPAEVPWAGCPKAVSDQGPAPPTLDPALVYRTRGWSVVPQLPGAKKPCVLWKAFQQRLPSEEEVRHWFELWPQAGLALVLGPVSGVFAIDVDGPEAHQALLDRLGGEPVAPKSLSGSRKPYRYHLLFACPNLPTKAKATPWHPKLEFRGQGGVIILPPSRHQSGHRYAWAPSQSPDALALPEVPPAVLQALAPRPKPGAPMPPVDPSAAGGLSGSPQTRRFLQGHYANGPQWNDRLFRAACDLSARGVSLEDALGPLLHGAGPWNDQEAAAARRTIESAFSQPREPSRY
jgi:hypothetical protein